MRVFLLLLILMGADAWAEGGCTGSCGGDSYRIPLEDLAVDTFDALARQVAATPVQVEGKNFGAAEVDSLREELLGSIRKNEIRIFSSSSDFACPLKDNTGTCVTFLTETEGKQLSVDVGRLQRMGFDVGTMQRLLVHEAFRLKKEEDRNFQYSRRLAERAISEGVDPKLVVSFAQLLKINLRASADAMGIDLAEACPEKNWESHFGKSLSELATTISAAQFNSRIVQVCGVYLPEKNIIPARVDSMEKDQGVLEDLALQFDLSKVRTCKVGSDTYLVAPAQPGYFSHALKYRGKAKRR